MPSYNEGCFTIPIQDNVSEQSPLVVRGSHRSLVHRGGQKLRDQGHLSSYESPSTASYNEGWCLVPFRMAAAPSLHDDSFQASYTEGCVAVRFRRCIFMRHSALYEACSRASYDEGCLAVPIQDNVSEQSPLVV